ncbi:MAG: cysteine peptidase family C39 domain-containing protein, partial [Candidatus Omnitrophota bacterium]
MKSAIYALKNLVVGVRGKFYLFVAHIGSLVLRKKLVAAPEAAPVIKIDEPQFKSNFKLWIRTVAFIVVAIFMPEQVAQAAGFDASVIWQRPAMAAGALAARTFAPGYTKDLNALDIPLTIKQILKDVSNKPIDAIQLSPTVTIKLDKPLKISNQKIEEIYNWLKGKPCGSKALYELLAYQGAKVTEQDIAVLALTVDILNGIIKPEGNPGVIKSSMYALSRASEFFGFKLYPVKLDLKGLSPKGTAPMPFIAHLNSEHYILVTNITDDKVYFIEEHKEEFLPKEKFLSEFSGYALMPVVSSEAQAISDVEAMKVMGARRRDQGMNTFGLVAGGMLFSQAKISRQSWSTFARQYAVTYAAPKLLKTVGFNKTISSIGGAFVSGAVLSGMDYKWNQKAMLSQAAAWGVTAAVQEYGYSKKWDKKLFVGATNLASTIIGTAALKQLGGNKFGVYQFGEESRPAYKIGKDTYVGRGLAEFGTFTPNSYAGIKDHFADAARLYIEDRLGDHNFAKALGSVASGVVGGNGSLKNTLTASVVQGLASTALSRATQDILSMGSYTGAVGSMIFTSVVYGQLSKIEGEGSRRDLSKAMLDTNIRGAIGGFFTGGIATLNKAGNLYYYQAPDAKVAATMLDFNRTVNGLPSTSWTRSDWKKFTTDSTWRPENRGFFRALTNSFFSNVHYQASGNVTRLVMNRINGVYNEKLDGTWMEISKYRGQRYKDGSLEYDLSNVAGKSYASLDRILQGVRSLNSGSLILSREIEKDWKQLKIDEYIFKGIREPGIIRGTGEVWTRFAANEN